MFGINLNSVLPMRSDAREQSEMVNQLLFGEHYEILEEGEKFLYIKSLHDGYFGWIDKKMSTRIPKELADELTDEELPITNKPIASCFIESRNENIILTGGSTLPLYDPKKESFTIGETTFHIAFEQVNMPLTKNYSGDEMLSVAFKYLNTPYLWGGRNALGIDCSGFVQVVLSICGRRFPRDAAQQVEKGSLISFLTEARSGDLAFFENAEGRISHVGILINNNQIIHSSGRVKIESIDAQGIISGETGKYTHQLRVIKRVL
jgi:gamma-D-glutamyl-L-lysine dipeptidyl-peptidase